MFIDANSRVDKEGLRQFTLDRLVALKEMAVIVCVDRKDFWERAETVAPQILLHESNQALAAIKQLVRLPGYIQAWIETAVDSPERFEFFVLSKAHELKTGDQQRDYYWAMQIRHDQLVALIRVLELLLDKMKLWTSIRPGQLFDDPVFAGLTECGVEDQVYLEAEKVYQERQRLVVGTGA